MRGERLYYTAPSLLFVLYCIIFCTFLCIIFTLVRIIFTIHGSSNLQEDPARYDDATSSRI